MGSNVVDVPRCIAYVRGAVAPIRRRRFSSLVSATLSATRLRVHVTGASLASSAARLRGVVARAAPPVATLFVLSSLSCECARLCGAGGRSAFDAQLRIIISIKCRKTTLVRRSCCRRRLSISLERSGGAAGPCSLGRVLGRHVRGTGPSPRCRFPGPSDISRPVSSDCIAAAQ